MSRARFGRDCGLSVFRKQMNFKLKHNAPAASKKLLYRASIMCHANSSLDSLPFPSIFLTSINLDATLINKLLHASDRCPDIYRWLWPLLMVSPSLSKPLTRPGSIFFFRLCLLFFFVIHLTMTTLLVHQILLIPQLTSQHETYGAFELSHIQ